MRKTRFWFLLSFLWVLFTVANFSETIIQLPMLLNPDSLQIDNNQLYITEETTIFIYNLKNLKFKKKFGREGEGPQEFLGSVQSGNAPLGLDVQTTHIIVNSLNKVSYFTKQGKFVKEIKTEDQSSNFKPLGDGFAGQNSTQEGNFRYRLVNIYDSKLNEIKEVFRVHHSFQRKIGAGFKVLVGKAFFKTYKDKLFVAMEHESFKIRVFDANGKSLYSITHKYSKQKVTENFKRKIRNYFKTHPRFKNFFNLLKPLRFPEYFPPIRLLSIDDGKIYVFTYKQYKDKTEGFIFDLSGNLLRKLFVPVRTQNDIEVCPYTIKNGKFYQVAEDLEKESWSIYINEL